MSHRISASTLSVFASLGVLLGGCQGIHVGNGVALGVTIGLFFGTLQLGRSPHTSATGNKSEPRTQPSLRPGAK